MSMRLFQRRLLSLSKMISRTYVCYFVCLTFPICTRSFGDFFSSSSSSFGSGSSSSRSSGRIQRATETEIDHGREVRFCSYKGLKLLPGAIFTDYEDCNKCECTDEWLSCHTKESRFNSGNGHEDECEAVKIGCETEWVLKANHSLNCGEGGHTSGASKKFATHPDDNFSSHSEPNSMFGHEENTTTEPQTRTLNKKKRARRLPGKGNIDDMFPSSSWF